MDDERRVVWGFIQPVCRGAEVWFAGYLRRDTPDGQVWDRQSLPVPGTKSALGFIVPSSNMAYRILRERAAWRGATLVLVEESARPGVSVQSHLSPKEEF